MQCFLPDLFDRAKAFPAEAAVVVFSAVAFFVCLTLTGLSYMALANWKNNLLSPRVIYNTAWRDLRTLVRLLRLKLFLKICESQNRPVSHFFSEVVRKHPSKVCLLYEDQQWTFQQVEDLSNQIANYFEAQGYRKGDTVALFMENRPEFICIWLGLSKIGIVTAMINTNLRLDVLTQSITVINCKTLIYSAELSSAVRDATPLLEKVENMEYFSFGQDPCPLDVPWKSLDGILKDVSTSPVDSQKHGVGFGDKLFYIYTSGTTGYPKAAVVSHRKVLWYAGVCRYYLQMNESDIIYNTLPLYHSAGGVYMVAFILTYGATMAIRKKFSASNFWKDAIKYNASVFQYIGEMCRYLLAQPKKPEDTMHKIRLISGNGLRAQIWPEFTQRFKINLVAELYGATESNSNLLNMYGHVGSVGFTSRIAPAAYPVSLIKVDKETGNPIRGENGLCIACKPGEPGELVGKVVLNDPAHHFDGYADPKATEKKIVRDCFRKGDMAFLSGDILVMDDDGYFYFVDRTGDTFRWKGENVSTNEVESVISKVLGLMTCAVYGVEIPGTEGKAGMAAIQRNDDHLDVSSWYTKFRAVLPNYAIPLFIRICDDIEATGTYKIRKVQMQNDGYDPEKTIDPLYFLDTSVQSYVRLDDELYKRIIDGKMRL